MKIITEIDVSVVIVNYNTKTITENCIRSIIANTKDLRYEIILVDNASIDNSVELFEKRKDITFIKSPTNLGFGKANNLGVSHAIGKFVFLLNSDTVLIENSIKNLFEFYKEKQEVLKIGVLGCLLIDVNGEINGYGENFPDVKSEIFQNLKRLPLVQKLIPNRRKSDDSKKEPFFNVDYVIGADMFLEKEIFEKYGGFDPMYFMYYEESDLQLKMARNGLKNYVVTTTKIIHLEDASNKINDYSNRKRIVMHSSRILYLKKNWLKKYRIFLFVDKLILSLSRFNRNYAKKENEQYISSIKKIY